MLAKHRRLAANTVRVYTRFMDDQKCYCIMLRKASRRVSALYDEALASFGINIAQFSLLQSISKHEPVSLTELAHRVDLDRSTLGRNVKVLEKLSLLSVGQGKDQREAVIELAPQGRKTLSDAVPAWESVQNTIAMRLGTKKVKQLQKLLASF